MHVLRTWRRAVVPVFRVRSQVSANYLYWGSRPACIPALRSRASFSTRSEDVEVEEGEEARKETEETVPAVTAEKEMEEEVEKDIKKEEMDEATLLKLQEKRLAQDKKKKILENIAKMGSQAEEGTVVRMAEATKLNVVEAITDAVAMDANIHGIRPKQNVYQDIFNKGEFKYKGDEEKEDYVHRLGSYYTANSQELQQRRKKNLIQKYCRFDGDTGSSEVQVAVLTERIRNLDEHFKFHHKDKKSKRGYNHLKNRRRRLLKYLERKEYPTYVKIMKDLDIDPASLIYT